MTSLPLTFSCGFQGNPKGITGSPELELFIRHVASVEFTGSGKQCYNRTNERGTALTIAASATASLDLKSGLTNPLNESISGGNAFAKIYGVMVEHDADSLATTGIRVMGGASQPFQGPRSTSGYDTLTPGMGTGFWCAATKAGWTVTATTAQQIDIVNLDASNAATVNVFLLGTTS